MLIADAYSIGCLTRIFLGFKMPRKNWIERMNCTEKTDALEILIKSVRDALDSLENDDWRCDQCDKDQKPENSNAAYYLRDALSDLSEFGYEY